MAGTLGTLLILPRLQAQYQGAFSPGALAYFYEAGTETPLDTYTSQDLSVANENPVEADAYGLFGPIYLLDRAYKVVLKTAGGVEIFSQDNVRPYSVPALNRVDPSVCDGRLTLTSGTPVTTADVTAATTVYFTPYKGNRIALYNATYGFDIFEFSELSLALGADAASLPYDVFAYQSAGTVSIERLAWTNASTRATALTRQNGVLVKSGDPTRRYLGSYRTTSVIGQTEDSYTKRLVWNYYNRVKRTMRRLESTSSWTYTTATFRQANGAAVNQLAVMIGVAEVPVEIDVLGMALNSSASVQFAVSIGEDSTTTPATGVLMGLQESYVVNDISITTAQLRTMPAAGYHYYPWLEISLATGTTTWQGTAGTTRLQSGMVGSVEG